MERKYSDILGLNPYFQPAYDLTNEVQQYWKQFIPNAKFFDVLRQVLNSFEGRRASDKQSLWLQGTYGTGKSHATAVIKHLLFDPFDDIEQFISNFEDAQLKSRLMHFRGGNHNVFPVVLKGSSNITDNRTFALVLEKAVKHALTLNQVELCVKSDFERIVEHIETNPGYIGWEKVIQSYPQLKMYARDKSQLVKKLREENIDMLKSLEGVSSEIGVHFSHKTITTWLQEVSAELRQQGVADSLMIYWDEFTSVLELPNSGVLLTELQSIAELSVTQGIYLFMVSHRTPNQARIATEDMEKVLGRFKTVDYSMESITTYHIIGASICKTDRDAWETLRDRYMPRIDDVLRRIVGSEGSAKHYTLIKNLFPLHPYTAYLATFIARNLGSTERSIFSFLYHQEKGFLKFIQEQPSGESAGVFLTADSLWDFFFEEFERLDPQRFSAMLDRYKLHISRVEEEHEAYVAIFKGILLLNVQFKMVLTSEARQGLVAPSLSNLKSMFWGTEYAPQLEAAIDFFEQQQIFAKNPDDLFLVSSSSLPFREVEKEKAQLKSVFSEIGKVLSASHVDELASSMTASILRQTELQLFDASFNEHLLKNKLQKAFHTGHSLHLAVFIARTIQEREQIKKTIQQILQDPAFTHILFLVCDTLFDEALFQKFLDYHARAAVAERHHLKEEQTMNADYAQKVLGQWMHTLKAGYVEWYCQTNELEEVEPSDRLLDVPRGKILIRDFSSLVNNELAAQIFQRGVENLEETRKNKNAWNAQMSKTSAETFLFADSREFIEQKTKSGPSHYTREIIKTNTGEYIVDEHLNIKKDVDEQHPVVSMGRAVTEAIMLQSKSGIFHLGDALHFLTKPPYGVYKNMLHFATVGFLLRNYIGKLYEADKGKPIEKEMMRDKIVALFQYWENGKGANKLLVRLGTKDEKLLIQELTSLFGLRKIESLKDAKWGIRSWIKNMQYPLWVFKLSEHTNEQSNLAIDFLLAFVQSVEADLPDTAIKQLLDSVKAVEHDLKLLVLKKEQSPILFLKWLQTIENLSITPEQFDVVMAYVRQHMPEEIGVVSWKEENVREKVKDWYIEQSKTQTPSPAPQPVPSQPLSYPVKSPVEGGQVKEENLEVIHKKIDAYQGNWRHLLKQVVNEHQELIAIFERYL